MFSQAYAAPSSQPASSTAVFNQTINTLSGVLTVPGGSAAGVLMTITSDTGATASATTASDGSWSASLNTFPNGSRSFGVRANLSTGSSSGTVVTSGVFLPTSLANAAFTYFTGSI